MSEATGTELPGSRTPLFDHALRLHRLTPDAPLPRGGEPFPDDEDRRRRPRPEHPPRRELIGVGVAAVLDEHFTAPQAPPERLTGRFRDVHVPIHPVPCVGEAALRAPARAREAGRRLVRRGTDRDDVIVGTALLAAVGTADDIPYLQTVGLLSDTCGPLTAHALERLPGGAEALLWLADRVAGWGRVYVVEALCRLVDGRPDVRRWLLRRAVDGDFLNGYFAGKVAQAAGLREALAAADVDPEIVEHAGGLLHVLMWSQGMGTTLSGCPDAEALLTAHLRHLDRLGPTPDRYRLAAVLARDLGEDGDPGSIAPVRRWQLHRDGYLALLDREDWCGTARNALAAGDVAMIRLAGTTSGTMSGTGLRAFDDRPAPSGEAQAP
ncbi:hypothetical protein [Streptomyces sp. UH6]|uniref:hypothetical protein n=1 Tax=Streptomyces sp. UH6 TaxID=2748379 RepID=UPI00280BDC02|nr:hypothetical protein [Streptomyces sp. UH6]